MLCGCTFSFLLVTVIGTTLIFGTGGNVQTSQEEQTQSGDSSQELNNSNIEIDIEEYEGVVLQLTTDGGQGYMDETIFIGDSNTVGLYELYGLVGLENYMGKVGMTVEGASNVSCVFFENDVRVYTIPEAITKVQPRRIILTFGTNNADGNTSTDRFIDSYENLINTLQASYAYMDIIVSAIPPKGQTSDYPNVSQNTIDVFNNALVEMCEKLDLPFLNISETLKDETSGYINPNYISADGLHLNEMGGMAWLSYARTHIYDTEDIRPAVTDVPNRLAPPAPVAGTPVPPTCLEQGYTPYEHWDGTIEKRDIVEALGHEYDENGICIRCGVKDPDFVASSSSSSSSSSSQSAVAGVPVAATCGANGYTPYTLADGTIEHRDIVPATGLHTFADGKCTVCGAADPNYVAPSEPVAGTPEPPTCTTEGYTPYTHSDGTVERRDIIPALGHNFDPTTGLCLNGCGTSSTPTDPSGDGTETGG